MDKWADYLVTAVRYNGRRTHIDAVKACADRGDSVGAEVVMTRQSVVASMDRYTFMTANKGSDGKLTKGARIEAIVVNGVTYLRTDANRTPADNLGNLPEF